MRSQYFEGFHTTATGRIYEVYLFGARYRATQVDGVKEHNMVCGGTMYAMSYDELVSKMEARL